MAKSDACFSATSYSTGYTFNPPVNGEIYGIKLVHKSGGVTCSTVRPYTNWGCEAAVFRNVQNIYGMTYQTLYATRIEFDFNDGIWSENKLNIYLFGYEAAFRLNINCNNDTNCTIYCLDKGCSGYTENSTSWLFGDDCTIVEVIFAVKNIRCLVNYTKITATKFVASPNFINLEINLVAINILPVKYIATSS